jgi:pimeloyl-ACP methyl ester carboxylesterase
VTGEAVLVHGAWHGAWCWDGVVAELRDLGVRATAVELPLAGFAADVEAARSAIELAPEGSVVVGHSYGGAVISESAAGVAGITRLVYLAAFMTDADDDMSALMNGSRLTESLLVGEAGVTVDPAAAAELFYGDSDPGAAAAMVSRLRPMALAESTPTGQEPAWRSIPSTYVVCTNDRALPVESQRKMAARAERVVEWPTDHSPFVTRPGAVAVLVAEYIA